MKKISPIGEGKPIANFDGVIKDKGYSYATDWVGGRLLKISKKGEVKEVIKGYTQLADLGIDIQRGLIGMPEMSSNRVFFLSYSRIQLRLIVTRQQVFVTSRQ